MLLKNGGIQIILIILFAVISNPFYRVRSMTITPNSE